MMLSRVKSVLKHANKAIVSYCVLSFLGAEAMDAVDKGTASPAVFQLCKKSVVPASLRSLSKGSLS